MCIGLGRKRLQLCTQSTVRTSGVYSFIAANAAGDLRASRGPSFRQTGCSVDQAVRSVNLSFMTYRLIPNVCFDRQVSLTG